VALALVVFLIWLTISLGGALTNPSLGSSVSGRFAEWVRDHGGASIVNWVENEWYSHHPPKKGGEPAKSAIPAANPSTSSTTAPAVTVAHLPPPTTVVSPASPLLPGEGQWHPAGRTVDGLPALYETFVRPDAVHTSYVIGMAWMDTDLLSATQYSGSYIPGGGPFTHTAPVPATVAPNLVAAFNSGFRMDQSQGGYFTDGHQLPGLPLVPGKASFVVYNTGKATVADWGRDATLTPDVVSVRQNLDLIVDNGAAVPGLLANDNSQWGATLGGAAYVWRSGVGVTASGALVYVAGPALSITDLADLLVRGGAVRAMELDINTDWVNYSVYDPGPGQPASAVNGSTLLTGAEAMTGGPSRYFESWWSRDFVTMTANGPVGAPQRTTTTTAPAHRARR
jgi:hypothetical protein